MLRLRFGVKARRYAQKILEHLFMHEVNVKALSLAVGTAFAVMTLILSIIFGGTVAALVNVPETWQGGGAVAAAIVAVIAAFLEGVIMGAIAGWVYNASVTEGEEVMAPSDRQARGAA